MASYEVTIPEHGHSKGRQGLEAPPSALGRWAQAHCSERAGMWELVLGGLARLRSWFSGGWHMGAGAQWERLVLGVGEELVLRGAGAQSWGSWCSGRLVLDRGAGAQGLVLGWGAGARGAGVPCAYVCLFSSIQVSKPHHPNHQG